MTALTHSYLVSNYHFSKSTTQIMRHLRKVSINKQKEKRNSKPNAEAKDKKTNSNIFREILGDNTYLKQEQKAV